MSEVFGSKEWQRAKLSDALNSIFFSGEEVMKEMLAVHCTMDAWMAVGKVFDNSGDISREENSLLTLDGHINQYKLSLAECDDNRVGPFILPLDKLVQKLHFVGGWFTGYKIAMEKKGLFGIRFDPAIIFEFGFTYASNHHSWIVWNHERMTTIYSQQSDDEENIESGKEIEHDALSQGSDIDTMEKVLKEVASSILLHNDEVSGQLLSMHMTTDVFKAVGKEFTPGEIEPELIPDLLHGYIQKYRDSLLEFGISQIGVNALVAPLLRFENNVQIDPDWFNQHLSANEEYGLNGMRFLPEMVFKELGYKYASAENRAWAIMNSMYMIQRENQECSHCMKFFQETLQLREQLKQNKDNLKEMESFVALMFSKLEQEVQNNSANIQKTTLAMEGLLKKKFDEE